MKLLRKVGQALANALNWYVDTRFGVPALILLILGAALYLVIDTGMRRDEEEQTIRNEIISLEKICAKVGTSIDRSNGDHYKRTIYSCPDGQTHIR